MSGWAPVLAGAELVATVRVAGDAIREGGEIVTVRVDSAGNGWSEGGTTAARGATVALREDLQRVMLEHFGE